jgi:hypothetical protein
MGETGQEALRVGFDPVIKLEFHGAQVSSDAGLFAFRDLDEAAQLTESSAAELFDFRTGSNIRHAMTALLRQPGSPTASCPGIQPEQLPEAVGVAAECETLDPHNVTRQAGQGRRQGGIPCSLCDVPTG